MRELVRAEPRPALRMLDLSDTALTSQQLERIGQAPLVGSLTSLTLDSNNMEGGLSALAGLSLRGLSRLGSLRALSIGSAELCGQDLIDLGDCPLMEQLVSLSVTFNRLAGALPGFLSPGRTGQLQDLTLYNSGLTADDVAALCHAPALNRLARLSLDGNESRAADVAPLARWPGLARLSYLGISDNPLGDKGVRPLVRSGKLGRLAGLSLSRCKITLAILQELGKALRPGQLHFLAISNNPLDDEAARFLASSPAFADLEEAFIEETQMTEEGHQILFDRFGPAFELGSVAEDE